MVKWGDSNMPLRGGISSSEYGAYLAYRRVPNFTTAIVATILPLSE